LPSIKKFKRKIQLKILDDEFLEVIHESTLKILQECGVKVYSEKALKVFSEAGAEVKKQIVKIPDYLVEESLKKASKRFILCGRSPGYDLKLDGEHTYVFTNGTCTTTIDLETGKRRRSILKDLIDTTILADALECIHGYYPFVVPSDMPEHLHGLYELKTALNYTEKHIMLGSTSKPEEATLQVKMAKTVVGGIDELRKRPIISAVICTVPPLVLEKGGCEAAIVFAEAGIPVRGMSMPLIGLSSPITLAGALVIANAELLSLLTLVEQVKPGAPFMYALDPMAMDIRRGDFSPSLPEATLLNIAGIQLARKYELPCGDGFSSASKVPDSQAAYENTVCAMAMILAGADVISGPGGLESYNTLSYEQFIVDYEACRMILKLTEGFSVNEETLALNLILEEGPEGNFISKPHTLKHAKNCWIPFLSDISSYDTWIESGRKDATSRAKAIVKEILSTHKPEPLEPEIKAELERIIEEGNKLIPH